MNSLRYSYKNGKIRNTKLIIIVAASATAVVLLLLAFFAGYALRGALMVSSSDWVINMISKYYYQDIDTSDSEDIAADALVDKYLDIYSEYYTAEEYEALLKSNGGTSSGLGISYAYIPGSGITIVGSTGNSPAFKAGIRPGDVIQYAEKDGGRVSFNSSASFSEFVAELADGAETTFRLTDGRSVKVAKAEYTVSYVMLATNSSAWTFTGDDATELTETEGDAIAYLPDGAAYISISQFYGGAADQFEMAAEQFNALGCTTLILDLRNNGGGYVSAMQGISGCFESSAGKPAMEARAKDGSSEVYRASTAPEESVISADTEVYVLANGNTASASEALIGVLVSYGITDYGNIYISEYTNTYLTAMGVTADQVKSGRTYGKGIMQSTYRNSSTGEALKLTTHQIYWPDGTTIHGTGLSAESGCNVVSSPMPMNGNGLELRAVCRAVFGS